MWSEEIRNNLSKELEIELDNKKFYTAKDYYNNVNLNTELKTQTQATSKSNLAYAKNFSISESSDFSNTVKGISFSNKVDVTQKQNTIDDLSLENRKIYKIADLLSANLTETVVIPYNVMTTTSLTLVKKFDWKDVLFADVGTAWGIIKSKFKW